MALKLMKMLSYLMMKKLNECVKLKILFINIKSIEQQF